MTASGLGDPVPLWSPDSDTRSTPPGCDKLINLLAATGWDRFEAIGRELLAGPLSYDVMEGKLDEWSALIGSAVEEDPYIDYDDWQEQVAELRWSLEMAIVDFTDHLSEGYVIQEPEVVIPEPDDATLNAERGESGLLVDIINNYEFTGGAEAEAPKDVYSYAEDTAVERPWWHTDEPLSGTADLRFDFEFNRVEGAWNEWVGVGLGTDDWQEFDLSDFTEILITLKTDRDRDVRVRVNSEAYDDDFGDVQSEFGVDFNVTDTPTIFKLKLERLSYPDWAKDDWGADQGWTTTDAEARALVLTRFTGLIFSPAPTRDDDGEMIDEVEVGHLQIDNIYFR